MFRLMKAALFGLVLAISLVGSGRANCPAGDLNSDCAVDMADLQLLAEQWLAPPDSPADLNGDDAVNITDFVLLAKDWRRNGISLVINEVMASNNSDSGISDPQGEYDDWIEIYNFGDTAIDVGGMYLTDDLNEPTKWQFPDNDPFTTTILADGYLLIWADEDIADAGLHANFKLSADGEELGLFDTDGSTLIDSFVFGEQTTNVSYGRYPDASDDLRFFDVPSPQTANEYAYTGIVEDLEFSHERGFYDTPFEVTIACATEGATIWYSLDGSEPYRPSPRGVGFIGTVYTGPIPISSTTCLRAGATKTGWESSNIDTHTYIFLDDVINQPAHPLGFPTSWGYNVVDYAMDPDVVDDPAYAPTIKDDLKTIPSIVIVLDNDDFFGAGTGIYANASARGIAWERPASIEWIDPASGADFQVNAGLRTHGGVGRSSSVAKHSLRMLFKNEYGPTQLEFPLFEDSDVENFESLVLRATWNYSYFGDSTACGGLGTDSSQYLRDQFARDTVRDMGGITPYGRHVHLYINGLYWGLYILTERPDDGFAAIHLGGEKEDYDVLKAENAWSGASMELVAGDLVGWNTLFDMASQNLSSAEAYESIQQFLDVPAMIDYLLMVYYVGSRDAPVLLCNDSTPRNFYTLRRRESVGPFVFLPWDVEWSLEWPTENRVNVVGQSNPHYLLDRLNDNADFRMLLADHIHRRFFNDGVLTPNKSIERYMTRANEIDRAIIGESARWGDSRRTYLPYTRDVEWVAERDRIVNEYLSVRTDIVLDQLRQAGFYPLVSAPEFFIDGHSQHGGYITFGDQLTMANPNGLGTIYYTLDGSDPRLLGGGGGIISSKTIVPENAAKRVLVPTGTISDNWKGGGTFDDSSWISGTGGVGYEAEDGYESYIDIDVEADMYQVIGTCYIRIPFTVSAEELSDFDLMTLQMRYDDGFVAYLNGVEITRRNFIGIPAWNSTASSQNYDTAAVKLEDFDVSVFISALQPGDNILAIHGLNVYTTSPDFLISAKLVAEGTGGDISPTAFEYTGPVILNETTHVNARVLSDDGIWSALTEAVYALPEVAYNLRITEIMYHPQDTNDPDDPNEEFIELKNIGGSSINLNLVSFTNGIDFTFPAVELAAGEYILVVKDVNTFETKYGTSKPVAGQYTGSLANNGERIELEDAIGTTILDFRYGDGWRSITDGDGYSLTIIEPSNPDLSSWDEKDSWRASAYIDGSPGDDDSGIIPNPSDIVINEVMAHSHGSAPDWIELYNTTAGSIDIAGWYISDSDANLMKYEIASGTTIGAGQYLVFYQNTHFPFALSENGEMVCLTSALDANDVLTGYRQKEDFGASETGVSFGRYYKASTDNFNFVAMEHDTLGLANAYPKVGPIVINEIMYNPDWPAGGSYNNDRYEYIELHNTSSGPVTLYDYVEGQPWKFTDGIDFTFPVSPNEVTIPAGGYILVVNDPNAFSWRYPGVSPGIVYGPYDGWLANDGEKLEISKPGDELDGTRYYIRVDRVGYSDGSHPQDCPGGVDLWPGGADGGGSSLSRTDPDLYGNDPDNWQAAVPTLGQ